MEMLLLPPPPALRSRVEGFWALRGRPTGTYSGLPKPFVEMIVSLSGVHHWQATPDAPVHVFEGGWITPVQTGPRFAKTEGALHLLGARLTLPAATILFGRLGAAAPIPLDAVLGSEARSLRDRLASAGTDREALRMLAAWLDQRLAAAATMLVLPGRERLAALHWRTDSLADLLQLSPRGLRKRFADRFGVGPKLWLQLNRFDAVLASRPHPGSLADMAAAWGYADQAHMTLEFSRFAGTTPGRYASARDRAAAPASAPHFVPHR